MSNVDLPSSLARNLRHRPADAAEVIFARYAKRLSRLADRYLSRKLAGRVDAEDVVQSAFRTFFRRCAAGEFQIDRSTQIWQLLAKITVTKARVQGRRHTAARRAVSAEESPAKDFDPVAASPGAEDAAALVDQIEALLEGLSEQHCQVLQRRLQGD